jgi:outer membrane receptor protein involved in Fe transport
VPILTRVFTPAEYGNISKNSAAQYNGLVGGNTNLEPEKADTYTAGVVLTPTFLPDFNMTIDYYNITIKNFITTYGANLILNTCLSSGNPFYCNKVVRTQGTGTAADGSLWISPTGYIEDGTYNLGSQRANGIDFTAGYRLDLGRGRRRDRHAPAAARRACTARHRGTLRRLYPAGGVSRLVADRPPAITPHL